MYNFFCLSKHADDVIFAAHIVSALAQKINMRQRLYVASIPDYENLYPQVEFTSDVPAHLHRLSRKPVHQDIVEVDNAMYINTWIKQQRNLFLNKASGDRLQASRLVAGNCIKLLGLRKRISKKDLFNITAPKIETKIKEPFSFSGIVTTLMPHDFLTKNVSSILSAVSTVGYYADVGRKSDIIVEIKDSSMICGAISRSKIIVSMDQISLLPYYQFAKDKKIFLIADGNSLDIFKDVTVVHDVHGLIKSLTAVVQGKR